MSNTSYGSLWGANVGMNNGKPITGGFGGLGAKPGLVSSTNTKPPGQDSQTNEAKAQLNLKPTQHAVKANEAIKANEEKKFNLNLGNGNKNIPKNENNQTKNEEPKQMNTTEAKDTPKKKKTKKIKKNKSVSIEDRYNEFCNAIEPSIRSVLPDITDEQLDELLSSLFLSVPQWQANNQPQFPTTGKLPPPMTMFVPGYENCMPPIPIPMMIPMPGMQSMGIEQMNSQNNGVPQAGMPNMQMMFGAPMGMPGMQPMGMPGMQPMGMPGMQPMGMNVESNAQHI